VTMRESIAIGMMQMFVCDNCAHAHIVEQQFCYAGLTARLLRVAGTDASFMIEATGDTITLNVERVLLVLARFARGAGGSDVGRQAILRAVRTE
jgi:hypothetical protein